MNLFDLLSQIHPFPTYRATGGFGLGESKGETARPECYKLGLLIQGGTKIATLNFSKPLHPVKSTVPNRASLKRGANCMLANSANFSTIKSLKYDYQFYSDVDRHPSTTAG
jgi:hypothetical protein